VRTVRGVTVGVLALSLLLAGCESDEPPPPIGGEEQDDGQGDAEDADLDDDAGEPDDEGDDQWAVPDEIDAAYVERVVDELLAIEWEMFRIVLDEGAPPGAPVPDEVSELSDQFRHPDLGPPTTTINETLRATPEIFEDDGESTRYHVQELPTAEAHCISGHGDFEFRFLVDDEFGPDPQTTTAMVALVPAHEGVDEQVNPTGWVFRRVLNTTDDPPPDPCEEL
jgi:hypothetical protein